MTNFRAPVAATFVRNDFRNWVRPSESGRTTVAERATAGIKTSSTSPVFSVLDFWASSPDGFARSWEMTTLTTRRALARVESFCVTMGGLKR